MSIRISIADSNSDSGGLLERLLSGCGFEVRVVAGGELLIDHVTAHATDVIVVTESTITDSSEVLEAIQECCLQKELVVIITPSESMHQRHLPEFAGPLVRWLKSPWTSCELLAAIFETTDVGKCDARIAHRTDSSAPLKSDPKAVK